jgi:hypothetical protein
MVSVARRTQSQITQLVSNPLHHCTTASSALQKKINLFTKLTSGMIVFIVIFSN